jgi:hypothetical protein
MKTKLFPFILALTLFGCNTDPKEASIALIEQEKASLDKQAESPGKLLATIPFNVRTNDTADFENGFIPWAKH